jgi:hypothetical protein
MTKWHGYFVVERGSIGSENWTALQALFENMGTHGNKFPAFNNHKRVRLDGDAIIYESAFDPSEVTIEQFKQLLADEFSVPIQDIDSNTSQDDYAGYGTTVWDFLYNAVSRFIVRRFGGGENWQASRQECIGYLIQNTALWDLGGIG